MIEVNNVSFDYNNEKEALHHIDLTVEQGECILLCGESGCGKTTVTKLINGLIPHFIEGYTLDGTVSVGGLMVAQTELYELAKQVGSVFQNPKSQFFNLDSDSELAFGLENEGADPSFIRARLAETVQALQIEDLLERNIFSMSGGEKQILAFASVYAMNPAIFVLDEPSANLDGKSIEILRNQIAFLKKQGHTVIIAEHRLYFLSDLIDRALYLKDGEIVKSFTGEQFCALTDGQRINMGLRTLHPTKIALPAVRTDGCSNGLSVEGLTCSFGKNPPVFEDISFSASPGEVVAITGRNGVGKTTLTRCLCGLMKERSGIVRLNEEVLTRKKRNRKAFCVMQDVNHQLFSNSVWGECEMATTDQSVEQIETALEQFDLLPYRDRHPMALSGGQKQRLAVVSAMLSGKALDF